MSQTMSLVLARCPDSGTRAFFSLLRAGGDVSESHNGCRSRALVTSSPSHKNVSQAKAKTKTCFNQRLCNYYYLAYKQSTAH